MAEFWFPWDQLREGCENGRKREEWLLVYTFFIYSCGLFYGTVCIVEYLALSGWLISECWIEQYVKVSGCGLILDSILEFAWWE
jgi:hypothetical protein